MLVNFDSKVDDSMRQKIADKGYTIQELLTVASMIEKETDARTGPPSPRSSTTV